MSVGAVKWENFKITYKCKWDGQDEQDEQVEVVELLGQGGQDGQDSQQCLSVQNVSGNSLLQNASLKCGGLTRFAFSQKFLKVARYVRSFCRWTRHTSQICAVGKSPIPS